MPILNTLPYKASLTNMLWPRVSLRLPWARRFWAFSPCISGGKTMQKNMDFEHPTFQHGKFSQNALKPKTLQMLLTTFAASIFFSKNVLFSINHYFDSLIVQILTRFQSSSENILPTPWPSALMRLASILYLLTKIVLTASARALAILALISALPSGDA